jgi:hypothetical protein
MDFGAGVQFTPFFDPPGLWLFLMILSQAAKQHVRAAGHTHYTIVIFTVKRNFSEIGTFEG